MPGDQSNVSVEAEGESKQRVDMRWPPDLISELRRLVDLEREVAELLKQPTKPEEGGPTFTSEVILLLRAQIPARREWLQQLKKRNSPARLVP